MWGRFRPVLDAVFRPVPITTHSGSGIMKDEAQHEQRLRSGWGWSRRAIAPSRGACGPRKSFRERLVFAEPGAGPRKTPKRTPIPPPYPRDAIPHDAPLRVWKFPGICGVLLPVCGNSHLPVRVPSTKTGLGDGPPSSGLVPMKYCFRRPYLRDRGDLPPAGNRTAAKSRRGKSGARPEAQVLEAIPQDHPLRGLWPRPIRSSSSSTHCSTRRRPSISRTPSPDPTRKKAPYRPRDPLRMRRSCAPTAHRRRTADLGPVFLAACIGNRIRRRPVPLPPTRTLEAEPSARLRAGPATRRVPGRLRASRGSAGPPRKFSTNIGPSSRDAVHALGGGTALAASPTPSYARKIAQMRDPLCETTWTTVRITASRGGHFCPDFPGPKAHAGATRSSVLVQTGDFLKSQGREFRISSPGGPTYAFLRGPRAAKNGLRGCGRGRGPRARAR